MIDFIQDVCYLSVHATPKAKRTFVGGNHDDALRVSVTEPADQGKANQAIIKALAKTLAISPAQIELVRGATHRRKTFSITDPPRDLRQQVAQLASIS